MAGASWRLRHRLRRLQVECLEEFRARVRVVGARLPEEPLEPLQILLAAFVRELGLDLPKRVPDLAVVDDGDLIERDVGYGELAVRDSDPATARAQLATGASVLPRR